MPSALASLVERKGLDPSNPRRSKAAEAILDALGPFTSRLAALEEVLAGSDDEALGVETPLQRLFLDTDALDPTPQLPGVGNRSVAYLEVGPLTLATAQRDLPSLRRLLLRPQLYGADAKTAIFVDYSLGKLDVDRNHPTYSECFREELVNALWHKPYDGLRQRFLGLLTMLRFVSDERRVRSLVRATRKMPADVGQRLRNTDHGSPLAYLVASKAPLSLVELFVRAGSEVDASASRPRTIAPILLAAGLRWSWGKSVAIIVQEGLDAMKNESACREHLLASTLERLGMAAQPLYVQGRCVAFLLKHGASPFAAFRFEPPAPTAAPTPETDPPCEVSSAVPTSGREPRQGPALSLLDLAIMTGEEDTVGHMLRHTEYRPTPEQQERARFLALTTLPRRPPRGLQRVAALRRIRKMVETTS